MYLLFYNKLVQYAITFYHKLDMLIESVECVDSLLACFDFAKVVARLGENKICFFGHLVLFVCAVRYTCSRTQLLVRIFFFLLLLFLLHVVIYSNFSSRSYDTIHLRTLQFKINNK